MKRIESNKHYLRDASVAQLSDGTPLQAGCPSPTGAFVPAGEWLTATRAFHLEGGWGQDWSDPGSTVLAGQRFRLLRKGNLYGPSIWEIA